MTGPLDIGGGAESDVVIRTNGDVRLRIDGKTGVATFFPGIQLASFAFGIDPPTGFQGFYIQLDALGFQQLYYQFQTGLPQLISFEPQPL